MNAVLQFAVNAHHGQFRKESGVPYVMHPLSVASKLVKCGIHEPVLMAAAMLHDVLEDTNTLKQNIFEVLVKELTRDDAEKRFEIVEELTSFARTKEEKEQYLDSFAAKSIEALVIKIVDRLDNVEDYNATNPQYAVKYFRKADNVFKAFYKREAEVLNRFGVRETRLLFDQIHACREALRINNS